MANPIAVPAEWIRNRADELAVEKGCRWDASRGQHFINTVQNHFRLYEGTNFAGQLVRLIPYQIDYAMRLYSWVRWSDFYGRWIRRFRRSSLWVPKKNGKSPFGAMHGNYLTVADGEIGGKTYAVAKDGGQARIVHDHALKMVEQSPELLEQCKITQNPERRITHLPSLSWFGILAGDNIESQEGCNGNAIIDEAHVVVNRLARVLKYMGASREEPLELAFSTAGDNVDGWGKKRWDYGERVNAGEVKDLEFLHVCYAAPQDATDEQLRDPKMWRACNPAMGDSEEGYILDEERFGEELEAAAGAGLQEWADFKKYRFNIWQASAAPWLNLGAWQRSGDEDDRLEDGDETWGGLDLSATSDFTAFALVQKRGDDFVCKVRHFVSSARAQQHFNNGLPVYEWERDGWLTICPNNRIDYDLVYSAIDAARQQYDIVAVGYDKAMAEPLRQHFEPLGLEMHEIQQGFWMSNWYKQFETFVSGENIRHGGDPVLAWMAKNVTKKENDQQCLKAVKPSRDELKAIDGVVALVMAIGEATEGETTTSVYDEPGAMFA